MAFDVIPVAITIAKQPGSRTETSRAVQAGTARKRLRLRLADERERTLTLLLDAYRTPVEPDSFE
jgi:hypothetical protein